MIPTNHAWGISTPQLKPLWCLGFGDKRSFGGLNWGFQSKPASSSSSSSPFRHPKKLFLRRCCTEEDNQFGIGNGTSSASEWDWNRWSRHISEIEQTEAFSSLLKFQLEEAIEKEDFEEAAKLKLAIAEATSKDCVAEIMSQLKVAIVQERYHDASKLSKNTGSGLVGWWVGYSKETDDPFGRIVRITPGVGRFIAKCYSPRQLVTASPGTPLFEIFVVKEADEAYHMQVVYLQRIKGSSTNAASSLSKSTNTSSTSEVENSSVVDLQENEANVEKSEEKAVNLEGASEEGIKSVINFLKDKIPGLKVKLMELDASEVADNIDSVRQFMEEDHEKTQSSKNSEGGNDDVEEIQPDEVAFAEGSNPTEDGNTLDTKLFIGGIVHNTEKAPKKEEFVRLPAGIKNLNRDSFVLHLPKRNLDSETRESKVSEVKVAAIASQSLSELMPSDVAKAFWSSDKVSPKVSRDVREIVKRALSQARRRNRLSEYTTFNRISTADGNLDPFDGLYVGSFGPYSTEIVQLKRKYGHWNGEDNEHSDVEFYEYVEAVTLTGDLNGSAAQVTFRAKIGKESRLTNRGTFPDELGVAASYKGQGRIAKSGVKNPKWVEGELLQFNGKGGLGPYVKGADLGFLYIVPEQSFLVLFNRLRLPE